MVEVLILTENAAGGESVATQRLIRALKKIYPKFNFRFLYFKKQPEPKGRFSFIPNILKQFKEYRTAIKRELKNKNTEFILSSGYLHGLAAITASTKKTFCICLFHGTRSIPWPLPGSFNYRQAVVKLLERLNWSLSDAVTVPSNEAKSYVTMPFWPINKSRIFVVPNIVPQFFFQKKKVTYKKFQNILYSGRIEKFKGLENIVPALFLLHGQYPNIRLCIAHPVNGANTEVFKIIKKQIEVYRLRKNVMFYTDLTEKKMAGLYKDSILTILPSQIEFAPLSVIESLASGTPVLGTDAGNIKPLLSKIDKCLLLDNNSPGEIAKKVVNFVKLPYSHKRIIFSKSKSEARFFNEMTATKAFTKAVSSLIQL